MAGDPKLATRDAAHDDDLLIWSERQAALLARPSPGLRAVALDWQELAEEIESVGRAKLLVVESLLVQIALHLLKLEHSADPLPRASWRREIAAFRGRIARELKRSPSLRHRVDIGGVRAQVEGELAALAEMLGVDRAAFGEPLPYQLEQLLDDGFVPPSRHGLD